VNQQNILFAAFCVLPLPSFTLAQTVALSEKTSQATEESLGGRESQPVQLPPVTVEAPRPQAETYTAPNAATATKTDTPIKEIPQSIQVIPRQMIEDQHNLSVAEAARNVSAVQATSPLQTPAYDSTYIGGFLAEQWLEVLVELSLWLQSVERVEYWFGSLCLLRRLRGPGESLPRGHVLHR
jgi:outer membrane receptor for monomeric catechols